MTRRSPLNPALLAGVLLLAWLLGPRLTSDPGPRQADLIGFSHSLANLAAQVRAATVHLEVTRRLKPGEEDAGAIPLPFNSARQDGSGFVVDAARGFVITNAHVVGAKSSRVQATLDDGRRFPADVVAVDSYTDLAIVKIPEGVARRELLWGDSDALRPGDMVIALGSPLGLESTTSFGIISATSREVPGLDPGQYQDYLQSDTFIDRGSSGGPLVDMSGAVVGVNTAILGRNWSGISYSIPSNLARYVGEEHIAHGRVRRGWLGVSLRSVEPGTARNEGLGRPYGALVTEVVPGSPSEVAGVRQEDIILSVNGVEVPSVESLRARIGSLAPGSVAKLRIWRNRAPITRQVVLGENPDL